MLKRLALISACLILPVDHLALAQNAAPVKGRESVLAPVEVLHQNRPAATIKQQIKHQLNQTIQPMDVKDQTLAEFAASISKRHRINVVIDHRALDDEGLSADDIDLTGKLSKVSLRNALDTLFKPHNLAWLVKNDTLKFTTTFSAELTVQTRVYKIGDLADSDHLRQQLQRTTWTETDGLWVDIDGDGGTVSLLNDNLIVRQTQRVHDEITNLLNQLRKADRRNAKQAATLTAIDPTNNPLYLTTDRRSHACEVRLGQLTNPMKVTSLAELVEYVENEHQLNCIIDLEGCRSKLRNPTSVVLDGNFPFPVSLRNALRTILEQHDLTAIVDNESVYITPSVSWRAQVTRFYPVGDLIDSDRNSPSQSELTRVLLSQSDGLWLDIDGNGGSVVMLGNTMMIRQTPETHDNITSLLQGIRAARGLKQLERISPPGFETNERPLAESALLNVNEQRFETQLKQIVKQLKVTSITELSNYLLQQHGIRSNVDQRAFEDEGLKPADIQLSGELKNITLRNALNAILDPHGLTFFFHNNSLLVTTEIDSETRMSTRIYPVADLLDVAHPAAGLARLCQLVESQSDDYWMHLDHRGGTLSQFKSSLIIRQTHRVHAEVAELLDFLRYLRRIDPTSTTLNEFELNANAARNASSVNKSGRYVSTTLNANSVFDLNGAPVPVAAHVHVLKHIIVKPVALQSALFIRPNVVNATIEIGLTGGNEEDLQNTIKQIRTKYTALHDLGGVARFAAQHANELKQLKAFLTRMRSELKTIDANHPTYRERQPVVQRIKTLEARVAEVSRIVKAMNVDVDSVPAEHEGRRGEFGGGGQF